MMAFLTSHDAVFWFLSSVINIHSHYKFSIINIHSQYTYSRYVHFSIHKSTLSSSSIRTPIPFTKHIAFITMALMMILVVVMIMIMLKEDEVWILLMWYLLTLCYGLDSCYDNNSKSRQLTDGENNGQIGGPTNIHRIHDGQKCCNIKSSTRPLSMLANA